MITVTKKEQTIPSFIVRITKIAKDIDGNSVEIVDREYQISPDYQKQIVAAIQAELAREQEIMDKMNYLSEND